MPAYAEPPARPGGSFFLLVEFLHEIHGGHDLEAEGLDVLQQLFHVLPLVQEFKLIGVARHDEQGHRQFASGELIDPVIDIRLVEQAVDGNVVRVLGKGKVLPALGQGARSPRPPGHRTR